MLQKIIIIMYMATLSTLAKLVRSRSLSGIPWKDTDFKFSVTLRHSLIVLHNHQRKRCFL